MVEGVRALPAGHTLTWQAGVLRQSSYWDLVDHAAGEGNSALPADSERQTAEHLRPMLEEAVRSQLVSDVPVGVFLSGGIDSSALVSILSRAPIITRSMYRRRMSWLPFLKRSARWTCRPWMA
jgi:asparagine synthase (glutamine-hydrolysing)